MTGQEEIVVSDRTPGEQALWCAVIGQAFIDATWSDPQPDKPLSRNANDITRLRNSTERAKARVWLRGNSRDFVTVCELAGMDPRMVREIAARAEAKGWPSIIIKYVGDRERKQIAA